MARLRSALRASILLLAMPGLAACGGIGVELPGFGSSSPPPPAEDHTATANSMAGRWLLSSPGHGQCLMTFGAPPPDGFEGTIAPQGGCPGKFFTSRKWAMQQNELILRDHTGKPLAQLTIEGAQFQGKATSGEPVTLTR
jgi:hypothetical protein